jgi:threonine dehydratase
LTYDDPPLPDLTLEQIQRAHARIQQYISYTPLMHARLPNTAGEFVPVTLKLENLQVTGSFKLRGALNAAACIAEDGVYGGITTGSGGNHGPAVARAGQLFGLPTLIVVPAGTPLRKISRLESEGAEVLVGGELFDEFEEEARRVAVRRKWAYLPPFGDTRLMAGHGTIALEIIETAPETSVLVVPIGSGGLAAGIAVASKALRPDIRIVGVEESWSPRISQSLRAGRVVKLPPFHTEAERQFPRSTTPLIFTYIRSCVDEIVLADDEELVDAARVLWDQLEIRATRSAASAVAAVLRCKTSIRPDQRVCALVCGRGAAGLF